MARIGVFICWCGENIARTVDVERATQAISEIPGVRRAVNYKYMCSDPGQTMIRDMIRDDRLDGVVVASCSPHMHLKTFRAAAAAETVHAHAHLRVLGGVKTTAENLQAAVEGEGLDRKSVV